MKNPFDDQKKIEGIQTILAVSSGKGGVGKSTVTVQLAAALKRQGCRVGLVDADIYGPSLPRMTGTMRQKVEIDENKKLTPLERGGVKILSLGHLIDEDLAVIWRGPMLFKAMNQLLFEVAWGPLDILLVDLPPGTGDVQLSLAQKVPVTGAIAVSTPQDIALSDVKKAIDMWKRVGVPFWGVVENMTHLDVPGLKNPVPLFPKGSLRTYLEQNEIPYLEGIPFHMELGVSAEAGIPESPKLPSSVIDPFNSLAKKLLTRLNIEHPKKSPSPELNL